MWKHLFRKSEGVCSLFCLLGFGKGLGPAQHELFIWLKICEGMYKDGTNEHFCRTATETQTLRTNLWTLLGLRGEGEGGTNGESNMVKIHTTICKTHSQWEFAVWLRELKPGLGNNPERWDWEGGGRDVQVGGDMDKPMADSCWCLVETNAIL